MEDPAKYCRLLAIQSERTRATSRPSNSARSMSSRESMANDIVVLTRVYCCMAQTNLTKRTLALTPGLLYRRWIPRLPTTINLSRGKESYHGAMYNTLRIRKITFTVKSWHAVIQQYAATRQNSRSLPLRIRPLLLLILNKNSQTES